MSHPTPALNGLEQAAYTLIVLFKARDENPSPLAIETHRLAAWAFVEAEARYLGNEVSFADYIGCHDRARELCKGL